jgi:hypothetical protein
MDSWQSGKSLNSFVGCEGLVIEFITDVEGNWDYFLKLIELSQVLKWQGDDKGAWGPGKLILDDHGMLVFGGDSQDKGPGDIRVAKTLIDLKRRYPSRVFLILGNRDINKLRFHSELQEGEDASLVDIFWDKKAKPYQEYLAEKKSDAGSLSALHWMLECNMGAQTAFQTRLQEIELLTGETCSSEQVLESFRDSVKPDGSDPWMLEFIQLGQLAFVFEDCLFVHGGVHDLALGVVPGKGRVADNVGDWVMALNQWKDEQVQEFKSNPAWQPSTPVRKRGGAALLEYAVPGGHDGTSIVCYNPFNNGNAQPPSETVEAFLTSSGIARVCSGHQPHGQSPSIVRQPTSGLIMCMCDTSYSDMKASKDENPANNRGKAAAILRIRKDTVSVEGVLADGRAHGFTIHTASEEDGLLDSLIGRQLKDGAWIKTVIKEAGQVWAARGEGHKIHVDTLPPSVAASELKLDYSLPSLELPTMDRVRTPETSRGITAAHTPPLVLLPSCYLCILRYLHTTASNLATRFACFQSLQSNGTTPHNPHKINLSAK